MEKLDFNLDQILENINFDIETIMIISDQTKI
jgi:hypothetical protein